jgi:alkanesulfonate monooxygenase
MSLRFHWRLVQAGQAHDARVGPDRVDRDAALPDLESQAEFCRLAERSGVESVLVDMNYGKPEPLVLSMALALVTERTRFMVATRPGLMSPTLFVQQVNTFSALTNGRITLNVVAGHSPAEQAYYGDHLDHDARYARMEEWLSICRALWRRDGPVDFSGDYYRIVAGRLNTPFVADGRRSPEIYVGGSSPQAREVAARHGDCWVRFGDSPAAVREAAAPLRDAGVSVGLRLGLICRESRAAAIRAGEALLGHQAAGRRSAAEGAFVRESDAVSMRQAHAMAAEEWPTPWLWTGLVRTLGAPAICLVGSPPEVAAGLLEFREAGVSQFILSGWPTSEEMERFGSEILPLVRAAEGCGDASGAAVR